MKILIYNTKNNSGKNNDNVIGRLFPADVALKVIRNRGKIIAKFDCNEIEEYINGARYTPKNGGMVGRFDDYKQILEDSCLSEDEMFEYSNDLAFNAIKVENLKALKKPLELNELFCNYTINDLKKGAKTNYIKLPNTLMKELTKAPQNMMWVYYKGEKCVLMSIQPYYTACLISGIKKYEIRKSILNDMKGLRV